MDSKGRKRTKVLERNIIHANMEKGVEIFADEQHLYHILLRRKVNDPVLKEYKDQDNIQSFAMQDFAQMSTSGEFKDYDTVLVLHDPTKVEQIDPATFYKTKEAGGKTLLQSQFEQDKAEADTVLANSENAKVLQDKTNLEALGLGAAAPGAGGSVHVTTASDTNAGKTADEIRKETAEQKKQLTALKKEYKELYENDAPEGSTIEELAELINSKKGTGAGNGAK